jgi:hypothetical protein
LLISGDQGLLAMLALLATNGMLGWQFNTAVLYGSSILETQRD